MKPFHVISSSTVIDMTLVVAPGLIWLNSVIQGPNVPLHSYLPIKLMTFHMHSLPVDNQMRGFKIITDKAL